MTALAAQLLNELMGADRNCAPNEKRRETRFDDEEVCKNFLCGFCPYDLFTNTRADLGPCDKLHDEELRRKYRQSSRFEKLGYEEDFVRYLQTLLSDVDKRIRKGQARLALNSSLSNVVGGPHVAREEKIQMLTEKINELVEQAELLGCEGKVEEAQGVMKLCEQLQEERSQLQAAGQRHEQGPGKDMEVCQVCGALLVVGDAQQRIDEHIMGKQHMGYAQIRSYIDEYKKKRREEEERREARLRKEREEREKERERERLERQRLRDEHERREKERVERKRRRSRSRDRHHRSHSRELRRSRSRDRRRHSRDHGHDRRRSRSRSHSRKSHHRDRSRTRDRSHDQERSYLKERSKERSFDRDRERSYDREWSCDRDQLRDHGKEPDAHEYNGHESPCGSLN